MINPNTANDVAKEYEDKIKWIKDGYESKLKTIEAETIALTEDNRRLREALAKYADKDNWDDGGFDSEEAKSIFTIPFNRPGYFIARQALSPQEKP